MRYVILLGLLLLLAACSTEMQVENDTVEVPDVVEPEEVVVEEVAELCEPDWICGDFGECVDGMKERKCADANACGTDAGKPDVSEACIQCGNGICEEGEFYDICPSDCPGILDSFSSASIDDLQPDKFTYLQIEVDKVIDRNASELLLDDDDEDDLVNVTEFNEKHKILSKSYKFKPYGRYKDALAMFTYKGENYSELHTIFFEEFKTDSVEYYWVCDRMIYDDIIEEDIRDPACRRGIKKIVYATPRTYSYKDITYQLIRDDPKVLGEPYLKKCRGSGSYHRAFISVESAQTIHTIYFNDCFEFETVQTFLEKYFEMFE